MLDQLLAGLSNMPDVWGEGALFAFSGMDGPTYVASGFVATYAAQPFGLLIHTPQLRTLHIEAPGAAPVRIATGDVYGVSAPRGDLLVTFSAWHTIIGAAPPGAALGLSFADGTEAGWQNPFWVTVDQGGRDAVVLAMGRLGRFALAYGADVAEAGARARAGLAADLPATAAARLAYYRQLPALPAAPEDRLLKKCFSVMKVNTLAPEGIIGRTWSTPDRVPHRNMWLWDSVFHSFGMNRLWPRLAWDYLAAMLDAQKPDGMVPFQVAVDRRHDHLTQPPLLAWGVWDNYRALGDRATLDYALPRLERYVEWDCAQRDQNGNGLLEWKMTGDPLCPCDESGLDNSPRFERGVPLDAVDFSALIAHEMECMARIALELGQAARAAHWRERGRAVSAQVHRLLWDEQTRFYYDRGLDRRLEGVAAVSGFYPLLLDDIPPDHVQGLLAALADPRRFNTAFPVASVAVSDPRFSTDMWRGPSWLNTNYIISAGLRRQGQAEAARRLAETTITRVGHYYREYGVLFEFYDAQDRVPPPLCDRKGAHREPYNIRIKSDSIRDYNFTAALVARLLLDQTEQGKPEPGR